MCWRLRAELVSEGGPSFVVVLISPLSHFEDGLLGGHSSDRSFRESGRVLGGRESLRLLGLDVPYASCADTLKKA